VLVTSYINLFLPFNLLMNLVAGTATCAKARTRATGAGLLDAAVARQAAIDRERAHRPGKFGTTP
jgi:hypothetical protein